MSFDDVLRMKAEQCELLRHCPLKLDGACLLLEAHYYVPVIEDVANFYGMVATFAITTLAFLYGM